MTTQPSDYAPMRCPACGAGLPGNEDSTIICQYCGTRLFRRAPRPSAAQPARETAQTPQERAQSAGQTPRQNEGDLNRGMRFSPVVCRDTQGTGLEAFRLLIPSGWQFRGGIKWRPERPGMPVEIAFQVFNPAGAELFEVFPNQTFFWDNNPMSRLTFPVGSFYYGNEVRQPLNAQQTLRQIILPRFRSVPGLRIVKEEHLPGLAEQLRAGTGNPQPGGQTQSDGARARVAYTSGGAALEEELFAVIELTKAGFPGMFGMVEVIFWSAVYLFTFRAQQGRLDGLADLFRTLTASVKINPQFLAQVQQMSQYMIQNNIRQIHNIGEFSRQFAQTANQISESNLQGYYQRQESWDRISNQFSQTLRDVNQYYDPNAGANVELPSGYTQAWSNPLGEYIVSEDPNFNPNIGSNQSWTPLNPSQ